MKAFIVVAYLLVVAFAGTILHRGRVNRPLQLRDNKIVGGADTNITDIPWQVGIEGRYGFVCGGSIVNERWVVTAAQCFEQESDADFYFIRSGTNHKKEGGQINDVRLLIIHPLWDNTFHHANIALLQVFNPFYFDATRQPIALAKTEPTEGEIALLSGWGSIYYDAPANIILQTATIPISNRAACNEVYEFIDETLICAGTEDGSVDVCLGDFGSSLVINNILTGVAAGGYGCGLPGYPGYYESIAYFNSWITHTIS